MAPGYPQPPEIAQGPPAPPPPQSVFSAEAGDPGSAGGLGSGQEVMQQIQGKLQELDKWASEMKILLDSSDKSLSVFLQPIAQAGLQLTEALSKKAQRSGGAGKPPVVSPMNPPNSPGGPPPQAGGPPPPQGV